MARFVLDSYSEIRPHLAANPVAGFRLTGFMTGEVPLYLRTNRLEHRLDLGAYAFEMDEMKHLFAQFSRTDEQHRRFNQPEQDGPIEFGRN